MRKLLRALWRYIAEDSAAEIIEREFEPQVLAELLRERAQAIIAATNVPTFGDAWGCVSCGAIQGEPTNFKCQVCGRSELLNLSPRLQGIVRSRAKGTRTNLRKVPRL